MNVSMQDAFNLGWKLAAVLQGRSDPALLATYSAERQPVARELIDFDREWSAMLAAPPRDPEHPERGGVDPAELQDYFVRQGRYTAGVATRYRQSELIGARGPREARERVRDRDALSLGAGHPGRRRALDAARPRGPRGRPMASVRLLRSAGRTSGRPLCVARRGRGFPTAAFHAAGCGHRRGDRHARDPAGRTSRRRARRAAAPPAPAQGDARTDRLREGVLRRPASRDATSSTCAGSIGSSAASSSCGPTSSSHTYCRSMPTTTSPRSLSRSCSRPPSHVREPRRRAAAPHRASAAARPAAARRRLAARRLL